MRGPVDRASSLRQTPRRRLVVTTKSYRGAVRGFYLSSQMRIEAFGCVPDATISAGSCRLLLPRVA
jgi:hypothetical protein